MAPHGQHDRTPGLSIRHVALWFAALALMLAGVLGTSVPGLPGVLVIYTGMWLAAWADGFTRIGWPTLTVLGLLATLALLADLLASVLGAKRAGASRQALLGSLIGAIAGFAFGVPGLIFGPFAGAVLGECLARGPLAAAVRVGLGTWLGLVLGTLLKIALAVSMLGLFVASYLF